MTHVVQSYRYPLEHLGHFDEMLDVLPEGARVVYHIEVEGLSYPGAIHACAEATRKLQEAGLPPVAWRDGYDACPSCGRPEEQPGTGEDEQGQLEL